jgi:hypothetical protein
MALSNAERQARYRARRQDQRPVVHYRRPQDRRSRPQRWVDAVETLRQLQAEYQAWLDNLPESLQDSPVAEQLEALCALDLDELAVELPRGFGRDEVLAPPNTSDTRIPRPRRW